MHFLRGFKDELIKTALPSIGEAAGKAAEFARGHKTGLGMAGAAVGGAAVAKHMGKKKGEKEGYTEASHDVDQIAQRARDVGRQEGVMAYHQALKEKLEQGG